MRVFVPLFAGLVLVGGAAACASPEASPQASRTAVRFSVGRSTNAPAGSAGGRLFDAYRALPQFDIRHVVFASNEQRLIGLQDHALDVTTAVDDVVYRAFYGRLDGESRSLDNIRAIAALHRAPVHMLIGPKISPSTEWRGMRVVLGSPVGTNSAFGEKLLMSAGISRSEIQGEFLPYDIAAEELARGEVDAAIMTGMLPLEPVATALRGGARLRAITDAEADRMRVHYPLMKAMLIPRNTYPEQPDAVHTVSVALLLVCRADLDNEVVYQLTRAYFEDLPESISKQTDPQRAPATVIPLHPGAARYYRERELRR